MFKKIMTNIVAANTTSEQPMLIDSWTARKTEDNKVSVIDVIADVTQKNYKYASNLYKKLIQEERVPQCEDRALAPRQHSLASSNPGCQTTRRGGFSLRGLLSPANNASWRLLGVLLYSNIISFLCAA